MHAFQTQPKTFRSKTFVLKGCLHQLSMIQLWFRHFAMSHPDTSGIAGNDFTVKEDLVKIWETNPLSSQSCLIFWQFLRMAYVFVQKSAGMIWHVCRKGSGWRCSEFYHGNQRVPDTRSILPFRTFLYSLWIRVLDHHSPSTPIRMGWYKSHVSGGQIPMFIAKAIPFFTSRGEFPSTHFQRLIFDQTLWEHPRAGWPRYLALWRFKPPLSCYVIFWHQWSAFGYPMLQCNSPVAWWTVGSGLTSRPHLSFNIPVPWMNEGKPMKNHCFNHHPKFRWTVM